LGEEHAAKATPSRLQLTLLTRPLMLQPKLADVCEVESAGPEVIATLTEAARDFAQRRARFLALRRLALARAAALRVGRRFERRESLRVVPHRFFAAARFFFFALAVAPSRAGAAPAERAVAAARTKTAEVSKATETRTDARLSRMDMPTASVRHNRRDIGHLSRRPLEVDADPSVRPLRR
jgi:hypothetical protein